MTGSTHYTRRRASTAGVFVVTAAALSLIGVFSLVGAASAAANYHVTNTSGLGVNIRSGTSTNATRIGGLREGQPIAIVCQTTGAAVNTSSIWDKLDNGGYISDYYTNTPVVGGYSPGLPHCDGTLPAPPPGGVDLARVNRAFQWFAARLGSTADEGRCEGAVDDAYQSSHRYYSAIEDWSDAVHRGAAHAGDQNPPRGALVFWDIPGYPYGHVGIARGDGTFVATSVNGRIGIASLPHFSGYLGWAWPNL